MQHQNKIIFKLLLTLFNYNWCFYRLWIFSAFLEQNLATWFYAFQLQLEFLLFWSKTQILQSKLPFFDNFPSNPTTPTLCQPLIADNNIFYMLNFSPPLFQNGYPNTLGFLRNMSFPLIKVGTVSQQSTDYLHIMDSVEQNGPRQPFLEFRIYFFTTLVHCI